MSSSLAFDQPLFLTIPRTPVTPGRHSLVIVPDKRRQGDDLEWILAAAEQRGFEKIATVLRTKIGDRDMALLDCASRLVCDDPSLGQTLVQFATSSGVLSCRAWVDQEQEERLIALLGGIDGAKRIEVAIMS